MVSDKLFPGKIVKMNVDDFANFRKKKSILYRDKKNDNYFFWNSKYKDQDNNDTYSYKNLSIKEPTTKRLYDREFIESEITNKRLGVVQSNIEININEKKEKNFESINHPHVVDLNNYKITSNAIDLTNKLNNLNNLKPVTSYGIVLYTYEKNKYLKYLICQRRDSIAFMQFMRNLIDEKDMERYIGLMTKEEKNRCLEFFLKKDPHTIWKDLWVNNRSKFYKQDYKHCSEQFMKNMEKYIELFKDENVGLDENTWFFPKGRKNDYETDLECALREFEEETNIQSSNITVDKNNIFEEFYIGSNNILYKTVYFTAYIPFIPLKKYKFYPYNIRPKFISGEVYDFEWLDYQTTHKLLNKEKSQVLEKINNFLKRSFKK